MSKVDAAIQPVGSNFELQMDPFRKVIIGDENSATFKPIARYSAFGEDGSGMIFGTPTTKNISPVLDKGVVGWDDPANNLTVRFYQHDAIPARETDPTAARWDNAAEHEVLLWAKPVSNEIPFSIELVNLKLLPQPPLTPEEDARHAFRPTWITGGFCAYHKTKTNIHFIPGDGERYKTGKAFDIPLPTATDANGMWRYGSWKYDEANSLLTAVFDPAYFDVAAYPITIGPTIGNTHLGTSEDATDDCCLANDVTAGSSGDANPGTAFYGGRMTTGTGTVYVCPYVGGGTDPAGKTRIGTGSSGITLTTTTAFQSAAITWTAIVSGTHYWLSGWSKTVNVRTEYDAGGTTGTFLCGPSSPTPPTPYESPTGGAFNNQSSIYVDFTAAATDTLMGQGVM